MNPVVIFPRRNVSATFAADRGKGWPMRPINQFEFYQLGAALHALKELGMDTTVGAAYSPIFEAMRRLEDFLGDGIIKLRSSRAEAELLLKQINEVANIYFIDEGGKFKQEVDWSKKVIGFFLFDLDNKVARFEHVLAAEMRECAAYYVPQIGMYNTADLVDQADLHIPPDLLGAVNEIARAEFRSAGRCLAFDLPSAAGFHALRAVESVLDDYYELFAGPNRKQPKSWNDYITSLKEIANASNAGPPSKKTIRTLDQLRDLDRNPLMHPRDVLSATDALVLLNLATSAIAAMAAEIQASKGQRQLQLIAGGTDG